MIEDPVLIEKKSFEIISAELGFQLSPDIEPIVKRVIHTTADFEYARILEFHPEAVARGIAVLRSGTRIYADTNMIVAGINGRRARELECEPYCLVSDNDVRDESTKRGVTRSIVAMERAAADPATKIFVIGNAPTALFTLKECIAKGIVKPELVIGVPVGFVGAAESKEEFKSAGVPYIITNGRKGGSTVAVAIVNALMYVG